MGTEFCSSTTQSSAPLRLRCASVLKPLYAWVAGPASSSDAQAAVTRSDNAATDRLVARAGGLDSMLVRLRDLCEVRWEPAPTWGRVLVTATEVAQAYRALAAERSVWSDHVLAWMREVDDAQTLGLGRHWYRRYGRLPALKLGWDLSDDEDFLRTHVVVVDGSEVRACLSRTVLSPDQRATWSRVLAADGPTEVLKQHGTAVPELLLGLGLGDCSTGQA